MDRVIQHERGQMPVKIRLRRMGRKKQAHFRIVVTDTRAPRDGPFVEALGHYRPQSEPARIVVDLDRVDHWMEKGAEVSDTVRTLLKRARAGGDEHLALGEVDQEAEKEARKEALAARRRAEAEALAAQEAEAAKAEKEAEKEAKAAAAAEAEAEAGEEEEGEAEVAEEEAEAEEAAEKKPEEPAGEKAAEPSEDEAEDKKEEKAE